MANFKTPLLTVGAPKKLFRDLKILAENDTKDEFKQERMFGRVAKIPTSNTLSEFVAMDFADYGDYATFLHIQDAFSRFPVVVFICAERRIGKHRKWSLGRRFHIC